MPDDSPRDKILIVDDNPENIWPLVLDLEKEYQIICATEGKQALEIAESKNPPALILLDIIMPDIDGLEVCNQLKANEATKDIPVIFLTAKSEDFEEVKGLELGAQDYITKPFSLPVVRARIKSVLNFQKELSRRLLLKTQLEKLNRQLEQQVQEKIEELNSARTALQTFEEKWHRLFKQQDGEEPYKRILVVDDNPENIHILVENLEQEYLVLCAASGKEALVIAFSSKPPDLILLDIMMPEMDGFEVCSRLKANASTWDIPIIFVTALGQELDEAKGLNLGATDFVTKPFSISVVKARIDAALRLKKAMDQRILLTRKLEALNKELENRVKEKTAALKQTQKELETSEKRYRDIYENAVEGIFQSDASGRFLSSNESLARMLGYESPEEAVNAIHNIGEQLYVQKQNRDEFIHILETEGEIFGFETRLRKKNGDIIWVMISAKVIRDESGKESYYQGFIINISQRKKIATENERLHAQLHQAQKMEAIGTLAGGIAHDFNNLLTGVQGLTSLMLHDLDASHPHHKHLQEIEEYTKSASDLTKQLLGVAKGGKYEVVPTDINKLITKSTEMFGRTKKEISIQMVFENNIWTVEADRAQIEQVLLNLYVNAAQAMPEGGELRLSTENVVMVHPQIRSFVIKPGRYVKISVTDTGIGMSQEIMGKIFEPFFTTKEKGTGTGLGLASAYGIIQNHGGSITVNSEQGVGSTFNIYLPASTKPLPKEKLQADDVLTGGETILLVDDQDIIILVAKEMLTALGYQVLVAKSGKEAVKFYTQFTKKIDGVILDMIMPDMNGGETFDELKKINPDVKVLLSSGYSLDGQAQKILNRGCAGFIQKPFNLIEFSQKIREFLNE